jgi:phosphate transport system ATP-binding protein
MSTVQTPEVENNPTPVRGISRAAADANLNDEVAFERAEEESVLRAILRGEKPEPVVHAPALACDPVVEIQDFNLWYGSAQALHGISMMIPRGQVTALIGPSGCGKSTLLRNMNRMNDLIDGVSHKGDITLDGTSLYDPSVEVISLRKRVGMVFQKYNPFPKSIYENVVFSLRVAGRNGKKELDETVERSLRGAALWDEVKDRLHESAFGLSGGQMQRLCIARAIANRPQILLMDEPCAALDPVATLKIETLMLDLKKEFTIVIVTHNMQQATRCSDKTAFFYLGSLIEFAETKTIFENPSKPQTEEYISGRFS